MWNNSFDFMISRQYALIPYRSIRIFGITLAAYLSELLNQISESSKKVFKDENLNAEEIPRLTVDRDSIENNLRLSAEEQRELDSVLIKSGIVSAETENQISINFEKLMSYLSITNLSCEDTVQAKKVASDIRLVAKATKKQEKTKAIIENLKKHVSVSDDEIKNLLYKWIDVIYEKNNFLSKDGIDLFIGTLEDYSGKDSKIMKSIIESAIINGYRDCGWAINAYEKTRRMSQNQITTSAQRTAQEVSTDIKF